jgi:hypothetical protein
MKKKILVLLLVTIISIVFFQYIVHSNSDNKMAKISYTNNSTRVYFEIPTRVEEKNNTMLLSSLTGEGKTVALGSIPISALLFKHTFYLNDNGLAYASDIKPNPIYNNTYQEIGLYNTTKKIVFVYPIFTQAAYGKNGFYDYYSGLCDSKCLSVDVPKEVHGKYSSSIRAAAILSVLNYPAITDIDIDKNPDILKNYDRVIILHNEYVTRNEFNAITNHPDVVYLYPNALYSEVNTDYQKNTITLVRGHGYPDKSLANGFGWKFDNSQFEYNTQCDNWTFYKIDNGKMLNCYPSFRMYFDKDLLAAIKS